MNSSPELSTHNPRADGPEYLITKGLGYCCEAFFWRQYAHVSTELIAARLGCAVRTVRRHRQWYNEGKLVCKQQGNCLDRRLNRDTSAK